jgi:hypothetical protein
MKPTSEQTRNGVLSAVPVLPEDLLNMTSFFRLIKESADAVAAPRPAAVDPSTAYGCVDWYLYPDPKVSSAAA